MVVGLDKNPSLALTPVQLDALQFLDGRTITIVAASSTEAGDAVDVEGTYAQWLSSIDAAYFIIRPDFYVAATAKSEAELSRRLDEVISKLHLRT